MISERALKEMAQVGAKLANAEQLRELLEVPVTRPSADQTQKHSPRRPSRGLRPPPIAMGECSGRDSGNLLNCRTDAPA